MDLVFLLAACANSFADNFPYKYMSCLWSLIWSNRVWGSEYLITWLGITVESSAMDFWNSYFFKLTLRNDCLELCFFDSCFQNHPDSVILQKNQLRSNQSFKHNLADMSSLNLTPNFSFEPRFYRFIVDGYYTKSKRL